MNEITFSFCPPGTDGAVTANLEEIERVASYARSIEADLVVWHTNQAIIFHRRFVAVEKKSLGEIPASA